MNSATTQARTGGQLIVDQLVAQGVDHVFCVPGESYLAVLDALVDVNVEVTVCRQEGGAAMMADAYGKLTSRPGICMVTRGPGASNALAGVHIAQQDSTPMILLVGQIDRSMREREAFQEMDYRAVFGSAAKWATEIDDVARIPEIMSRAFYVATSGRPGPVVIALPEDMLTQTAEVMDAPRVNPVDTAPAVGQMEDLARRLADAKSPIAILGGTRWCEQACQQFADFAQRFQLPVTVAFRNQMLFPHDHPCYIGDLGIGGNPDLLKAIDDSDLILLVGDRLSEIPSQSYTLIDIPVPKQALVHVHPDSNELGRVYVPSLAINTSPSAFAAQLSSLAAPSKMPWAQNTERLHASYLAWRDTSRVNPPGALQMNHVMAYLNDNLAPETVITNGAGNYATWIHRFYRFNRYGTQLAPTSGSMGYGLPAAVGAKRAFPDRPVVCLAGDGCFMMHGQEFATAVQYNLPLIVLVVDNGMYGTIRMHQEKFYPGRVSATDLQNPDFAAYAQAFGGYGERVERTEDFAGAFERAQASGKPAILHLIVDPQAITPTATIEQLRAAAQKS